MTGNDQVGMLRSIKVLTRNYTIGLAGILF